MCQQIIVEIYIPCLQLYTFYSENAVGSFCYSFIEKEKSQSKITVAA